MLDSDSWSFSEDSVVSGPTASTALSKLSNKNNYFYEPNNIVRALSSIVIELRELAASYGLDSSDIKIDLHPLTGEQIKPNLKWECTRNSDAKDIAF